MSQDSGLRAVCHGSEIMNIRMLQTNARGYLEKALSEQEKAFLEQDEALKVSEAQKKDLKKQLEESEAQNEVLKKQLEQSVSRNKVLQQRNNSIRLEYLKELQLSEEHKREKNELFKTIIELEKQLDVKTALALEIERIRGALLLIKQMHEDGDLQGRNKMNKIEELLKKKEEDLTMVELIVKEWISNDEIQEAQKELIVGLWDSSKQAFIHVKRVGVDINPFQTATSRNFFKEANIELLELWSLWADYTRDESWHPFKVIVDKVGNAKDPSLHPCYLLSSFYHAD
ncbi:factor of DNA methylation 4-like isoform X2 [Rosa rugosa]|uniref:factor of DNA methylation 4-like isoform X2 n=1 Tax=Rosa rugosa TaxID=74645 RepID=UPI002B41404B|nr:factor of DNA methylation 4-like isoform X2 [Rosa rugosa]